MDSAMSSDSSNPADPPRGVEGGGDKAPDTPTGTGGSGNAPTSELPAVLPASRALDPPRTNALIPLERPKRRRARKAKRDRPPGFIRRILRRHVMKSTEMALAALLAAPLALIVILSLMPELRQSLLSDWKLRGAVAFFMYDDPNPPPTPSKIWLERLKQVSVVFTHLPDRRGAKGGCGYERAVRVKQIGPALIKGRAIVTWPLAVKLEEWMRTEVQPNARKLFGQPVTSIKVSSSYDCRRVRFKRVLSQHSFANAIDITGLTLADGRHVRFQTHWRKKGAFAAFIHRVAGASCGIFSVALTPDFDYQHRHHFHFDVGRRSYCGYGKRGRRLVVVKPTSQKDKEKLASRK